MRPALSLLLSAACVRPPVMLAARMPPVSRILILALLWIACDRAPEPATAPVPSTMPVTPPPATPAPPPAADLFTGKDGLISVPRPAGDGWECVEQVASEPGQEASLIKCRHTDRARFFFLMAKDYSVPADQIRSAEELATRVFPTTYEKLFASHEIRETRAVTHAGKPAHELQLDAVHASMGKIRKRERVITHDNRVFVLSAEGMPDVFDAEAAAIEAWFAGVRFKNLP